MPRAASICTAALPLLAIACGEGDRPASQPSPTVTVSDTGFYQELSWSPDGSALLLSVLGVERGIENFTYHVERIAAAGGPPTRLTDGPRDYWTSWAPDGTRFTYASRQNENTDIYVRDVAGGVPQRLTHDPANDNAPDWAPDGSRIVFVSARPNAAGVYVMAADGSEPRHLGAVGGQPHNPVWSPEATRIVYYATDPDGDDHVYVMNADGSDARRLASGVWPSWSPRGDRILYTGEGGLYTMRPDGSDTTQVVPDAFYGRFSPDGSRIAYITNLEGWVTVHVMLTDGSGSRALLRRPAPAW